MMYLSELTFIPIDPVDKSVSEWLTANSRLVGKYTAYKNKIASTGTSLHETKINIIRKSIAKT